MMKCKSLGYVVEINLPEECGYAGYSVECRYSFNKKKQKYSFYVVETK